MFCSPGPLCVLVELHVLSQGTILSSHLAAAQGLGSPGLGVGSGVPASLEKGTVLETFNQDVVQSLSCVRLFATPWTAAHQASLSCTNSRSLLKLMSIESVMPSNLLVSVAPFSSCLQSFPASGSFLMSWLIASGGQSIGASASASVLPIRMNFLSSLW